MSKAKPAIIPLGNRVLVKPETEKQKTKSGIIIPDTVDKEKPMQGKVIAVGEGRFDDGKRVPMTVKKGDTVMFSKYGYDEVKIDGEECFIIKEEDILAIVKS